MRNDGRAACFLRTWREDYVCRTLVSAVFSFGCTALFALYNGFLGLCYGSAWHGSIGIFYFLLMVIRGIVLLTERRIRTRLAAEQSHCRRPDISHQLSTAAGAGSGADSAGFHDGGAGQACIHGTDSGHCHGVLYHLEDHHGLHPHWTAAAQTGGNILVAELRTVNFIDALVAILTLQNTLIMVKRTTAEETAMLPVSAASSAVIYAVIVAITIRMLRKGLKQTAIPADQQQT